MVSIIARSIKYPTNVPVSHFIDIEVDFPYMKSDIPTHPNTTVKKAMK